MILAAIYIPSGTLPHLFGKDHTGQTINFGGRYLYEIEEIGNTFEVKNKVENNQYFKKFWKGNIQLISAIVGENGVGKTSILNLFREHNYPCAYIYEGLDEEPTIYRHSHEEIIYYCPFLNITYYDNENDNFRDLSKYYQFIDDSLGGNGNMETHFALGQSENLKRWMTLIRLDYKTDILAKLNLPRFDNIKIKVHSINVVYNDISYNFRPFFEALNDRLKVEEVQRIENYRSELNTVNRNSKQRIGNRIKREIDIQGRIIDKVKNILEAVGNRYLAEGFLNNQYTIESKEFTDKSNAKEAFYWFLDNAYIQMNPSAKRVYLPKQEIVNFLDTVLKSLPTNDKVENWTEFSTDFDTAIEILEAYQKFILAFKDEFSYDRTNLLSFYPDKNVSTGERGIYDLASIFLDLKMRMENQVHTEYGYFNKRLITGKHILILLDEGDLGFHPEWKKRYISVIQNLFSSIFPKYYIQIILTTHDPLTLSDIPNNNVTYLKRKNGLTCVLSHDSDEKPEHTFGANINDLLSNSFFVKDGLIGDFAKQKIEETIDWIKKNKENDGRTKAFKKDLLYYKNIIGIIDEPVMKLKLAEMISELEGADNSFEKEIIRQEIERLEKKLNERQ